MSAPVTGPPPVLVACGLLRGDQHAYRCRSCGFESDDLSAFGTVSCWDCTERSAWSEQCQAGSCRQCVPAEPGDCAHECHDGTVSSPARSEGPAPGAGEPAASTGAAAGPGGVPAEPVTPQVPARSAPHVPGGLTLRRGPSSPGTGRLGEDGVPPATRTAGGTPPGLSWLAGAAPREWDVPLIAGIGAEWIAVLTFAMVRNARVPRLLRVSVHVVYEPPPDGEARDSQSLAATIGGQVTRGLIAAGVISSAGDIDGLDAEISRRTYPRGRLRLLITEVRR